MASTKSSSILLIASMLLTGVLSVKIIEQNHHEVTVKVGDEVSLVCTAETQVKACNFRDPKGNTFPIFEGARYDGGRITKNGIRDTDCGIKIQDLKDDDHGRWECSISAVNEAGDFSVGTSFVNVTVAVAPKAMTLRVDEEPVTSSVLRVKLDEAGAKKIDCVAEAARPRPTFKWYIGTTELRSEITSSEVNQTPDGKGDFIETLSYLPDPSHNGQSLQCVLEQMGYTNQQIEAAANIARLELELLFKPQQNPKLVQEFYELREGEPNDIRMMIRANPKPTEGVWNINGASIAVGSESLDQKYKSSFIEDGDLPGEYSVTLTINNLQKENVGKENELTITNEEGSTNYKFILEIGSKPPTAGYPGTPISRQGASASGPIVGIVILVIILVLLIAFGVFARVKGLFCFAAKRKGEDTEQAVEKEGSDTESAEDNSAAGADKETTAPTGEPAQPSEDTTDSVRDDQPAKPKGPTVAARFSNIFAAVKKSVASKGSNTKDKYATPEQVEAEAKLNDDDDKKNEDITYADIDKTALGPGTRGTDTATVEDEKTQYAEIKSKK